MQIEAGKYYRTRDGRKVGPFENRRWTDGFPWDESTEDAYFWSDGGKCQVEEDGRNDLVAEWADEPTGPVREVTRKEIVPGVYGRVEVLSAPDDRTPNAVQIQVHPSSPVAPHLWLTAAELRAAAEVLTQLADALEPKP